MDKIKIGGFVPFSVSDGPGVRSVIFLQGCGRACVGCHNPSLQHHEGGYEYSTTEIVDFICRECTNRKITISGGEPLEQHRALDKLTKALFERGFDICLFTGASMDDIPKSIFSRLTYVKVGEYKQNMKIINNFYGSSNQSFINVKEKRVVS